MNRLFIDNAFEKRTEQAM